ncbi:MAG: EI24 domain-containing protein [Giesbergeria sp.]
MPLVIMGAAALLLGHFYWDGAVAAVAEWINASGLMGSFWRWLSSWGAGNLPSIVAPLIVLAVVVPVVVVLSLLVVATMMTPALVSLVAQRRFPALERRRGASFLQSMVWSLSSMVLALLALFASMPLWLIPPLVLVLPPLVWGWLTYRVMAFDALAEHADREERALILQRHRMSLLLIGLFTGYLGAAPAIVWASGVVFAAAFFVLIPVGIWIYTLVFAFSSLWFAHYCLAALQSHRATVPAPSTVPAVPAPAQKAET